MYFLFRDNGVDLPVLVKANDAREARILFDVQFGFLPHAPYDANDDVFNLASLNGLVNEVRAERVETVGFENGTDSDEFEKFFV